MIDQSYNEVFLPRSDFHKSFLSSPCAIIRFFSISARGTILAFERNVNSVLLSTIAYFSRQSHQSLIYKYIQQKECRYFNTVEINLNNVCQNNNKLRTITQESSNCPGFRGNSHRARDVISQFTGQHVFILLSSSREQRNDESSKNVKTVPIRSEKFTKHRVSRLVSTTFYQSRCRNSRKICAADGEQNAIDRSAASTRWEPYRIPRLIEEKVPLLERVRICVLDLFLALHCIRELT